MTEKKSKKVPAAIVRPSLLASTFGERGRLFGSMFAVNVVATVLYAVQAVVLCIVANGVRLPVVAPYLTTDPLQSAAQGKTVLAAAQHELFSVNILWLLVAMLAIGAFTHALLATRFRDRYETAVQQGTSGPRWIGFTIVPTLLFTGVTLAIGVHDVFALLGVVVGSLVLHLGCVLVERRSQPGEPVGRLLYGLGITIGLLPLVVIAGSVKAAYTYAAGYPTYLYYLAVTSIVLGIAGALNFVLQRRARGKWATFTFGERLSILLGLITASAVTWQLYAGLLR